MWSRWPGLSRDIGPDVPLSLWASPILPFCDSYGVFLDLFPCPFLGIVLETTAWNNLFWKTQQHLLLSPALTLPVWGKDVSWTLSLHFFTGTSLWPPGLICPKSALGGTALPWDKLYLERSHSSWYNAIAQDFFVPWYFKSNISPEIWLKLTTTSINLSCIFSYDLQKNLTNN